MFMSLQVKTKPIKESETTRPVSYWVQSSPSSAVEVPLQDTHLVQNFVLWLMCLEKNDKEPNFPNSNTSLLPFKKCAGNRLKWLQGFPCRALQTCSLIPAPNQETP